MDLLHSDTYRVGAFETGMGDRLTLPAFLDLFQDLAGHHAAHLGFGMDALLQENTAWVLNRMGIEVGELPRVGEPIRIETWPSGVEALFAWRDVRAFDAAGTEVARGTTRWLIIDVEKRRPRRTSPELQTFLPSSMPQAFALSDPPAPEDEVLSRHTVHVRHADLDVNRHANNTHYAAWMVEAFDPDFLDAHVQTHLDMTLKAETLRGDVLVTEVARAADDPGCYVHRIVREADGRLVATGWSRWREAV